MQEFYGFISIYTAYPLIIYYPIISMCYCLTFPIWKREQDIKIFLKLPLLVSQRRVI